MHRKTRIWLGLGAAVMVGGTTVDHVAVAAQPEASARPSGTAGVGGQPTVAGTGLLHLAQAGEGGPGEGGGQVLGTITEFRLGSTDPNAFSYDASAEVRNYADLVHRAYAEAHDAALVLQQAIGALLERPSAETLEAAREAWVDARPAYLRTEAFQFYAGPVDAPDGPLPRLNAWPIDPSFLDYVGSEPESGIVNDPSVSLSFRSLARLNQADGPEKVTAGWHAIEFLLWGESGDRPYTDYVVGSGPDDRRREALAAMARLLVNDLGFLAAAWAPGANNYRAAVEAMDQRNAIGRAFNGMAVLVGYEIPLRRIGAGLFPANEDFQQSPFSDTSASDNLDAFRGARDVYFGSGFDDLVADLDPDLAARVVGAFERAEAALAALDAPYSRFLAPPAGSPERALAEAAVGALTDLGRQLRSAGNRLGVLVVVPGL